MKRKLGSLAMVYLLTLVILFPSALFGSENATATEIEASYPSSVSVSHGTSSGIVDDVHSQDGVYYSVQEADVNPGRVEIQNVINPNGIGTSTAWEGEVGPGLQHYEAVDEGPPSPGDENVSYITESRVAEHTDTFHLEAYSLPGPGYSIDEVAVFVTAMQTGGPSDHSIRPCVQSGVTLSCGTTFHVPPIDLWEEYAYDWPTNPDDGLAWEESDITNLEGGAKQGGSMGATCFLRSTLVYASVNSSAPIDDYRAQFTFDFTNIDLRANPQLEIHGYRSGDLEAIKIQVLRVGVWQTLDADAFGTVPGTQFYSLSTNDVMGGVASIRIVDANPTDDTQSTAYLDFVVITTEGSPPNPFAGVRVFVQGDYDMWRNQLRVDLTWRQYGGPEPANVISRFLSVRIDGVELRGGFIPMPLDRNYTYLDVPWSWLDGGKHNITVFGFVLVNWSAGSQVYRSAPENLVADNWIRFVFLIMIFLIILVAVVATLVHFSRGKYQETRGDET